MAATARGEADLQALADDAAALSGSIHAFPADITDGSAMGQTVVRIGQQLGPIDIAILNAGTHKPVSAEQFDSRDFAALITVNLLGTANTLEAVMPGMVARKAGHIAVVSSVAGYTGLPTAAYYGATKAALINLCEALKFDLDKHGVHMHLICPGFVRTPLTDLNEFPMPFLMEPEEAAKALIKGLQSDRFEITFPRRFTWMMKLLRVLPYWAYFPLVARGTKGESSS